MGKEFDWNQQMRFTIGSVLQFTADWGSTVEFSSGYDTWTRPMVGWAVCVDRTDYQGQDEYHDNSTIETRVEPVVLNEKGRPKTVTMYLVEQEDRRYEADWKVVPAVGAGRL